MSDRSEISWTDATWNPVRGCSIVSEGCRNCYAMRMAHRFRGPGKDGRTLPFAGLTKLTASGPVWNGTVRMVESVLEKPLRWKRPRRIFVNSMSDLFHESLTNDQIAAVFGVMAACPRHKFQVLTKRPQRMLEWFGWANNCQNDGRDLFPYDSPAWCIYQKLTVEALRLGCPVPSHHGGPWPLPNVWLGVSVENQETADERIPLLLETPAAVRWISAEPLLGPLNIDAAFYALRERLDWVVVGGESGNGARPMEPEWAQSIRDQCIAAGVPFHFKQWGKYGYIEQLPDEIVRQIDACHNLAGNPDASGPWNVGKNTAGRELDGRTWDEWPT